MEAIPTHRRYLPDAWHPDPDKEQRCPKHDVPLLFRGWSQVQCPACGKSFDVTGPCPGVHAFDRYDHLTELFMMWRHHQTEREAQAEEEIHA